MKFSELELHPALAAALAARGYETATDVQTAVLEPRNAGRDLLVSSQTGSGKTIAFGAAMVDTLLGAAGARPANPEAADGETPGAATIALPAFTPGGKRPGALVVVPTRELAVQVREELGWLLAQTRLRLGSFTGGTAVSGDLRNLQRGVDVAIGTPGRLVDLVTRERLDLSGLRVVVLDEADEMLDLGFREDLETLLKAAAVERRTLMLSATIPAEIRSMARKYQRDALAIDPRKDSGASPSAPHADINYVAHLISGHDRLATVVNVLRARAAKRAIVFCTTRDAVSSLHAALVARGFAATAISGERAQADRDRALGLIRSGQAQVLVATNVAARGLHLPDVDLIIHADLPLNAESLTHRSGRTGRAGRKGTAVVVATLTERRKAERLMSMAHVVAPWTPAPTPESITAAARERLIDALLGEGGENETPEEDEGEGEGASSTAAAEAGGGGDGEAPGGARREAKRAAKKAAAATTAADVDLNPMLDRLEARLPARELLGRLLKRELERLPRGESVHAVAMPDARDGRGRVPEDRERGRFEGGATVMFRVNMGAKDKADPKWILPLICGRGGVTRKEVGAIRVGPRETEFEITDAAAIKFERAAAVPDPRAPQIRFERVPGSGRPQRGGFDDDRRSGPAGTRPAARFGAPRPSNGAPRTSMPRVPDAAAPRGFAAAAPRSAVFEPRPSAPVAERGAPVASETPPSPAIPFTETTAAAPSSAPAGSDAKGDAEKVALAEAKEIKKAERKAARALAKAAAAEATPSATVDAGERPRAPVSEAPLTSEAKVKIETERTVRPVPETVGPRSDASDEARKQKRGTTAPVVERKQTPIRSPGGAGFAAARAVTEPRPPRNAFPPTRSAQAAGTFTPAKTNAASRPPQRAPSAGASAATGHTQGGFGPPRRFVAHAMPGRTGSSHDDGEHSPDFARANRASGGERDAAPPRSSARSGGAPSVRGPAREDSRHDRTDRPARRTEPSAFGPPSARLKSPPFRPGGPRPGGFPPGRGQASGFGGGGFKSEAPRGAAFKSGGGGKTGEFKAGGFKSRAPAAGGPKASFGAARTGGARDNRSTGPKLNRPHGK